jgi:hypothetical protein
MSVLIKRTDGKKLFCSIRQHGEADHDQDEPNDMARHGVPVPLRFLSTPNVFIGRPARHSDAGKALVNELIVLAVATSLVVRP